MRNKKLNRKKPLLWLPVILTLAICFTPYKIEGAANVVLAEEPEPDSLLVVKESFLASVSAYTSREEETDSDPFTTANGDHVYFGGIACPSRYKFGTKVLIETKIYTCNDRMNARYRSKDYFDIWMSDLKSAREFGRKDLYVVIFQ